MYTKKLGQLIKPFICKQIEQSDSTFPKQSKNHFNTQEKEVSINSLRVLLTRHYFFFNCLHHFPQFIVVSYPTKNKNKFNEPILR